MIIGVDGNEANIKNRVGVNTYAFELLWNIYFLKDEWRNKHKFIIYLKEPPLSELPKSDNYFYYKILPQSRLWIMTRLMPYLLFSKDKPNILFTPSHYLPLITTMPKVCSIMDLGYLNFTEQFKKLTFWQLKYWTAISLYISKCIIAISNSTRDDIVRHYPGLADKIRVTPLAIDEKRFNEDINPVDVLRVMEKFNISNDYILMLSTLKPSKNIEGSLYAFKNIKQRFNRMKLVIAGKKGWLYKDVYKKIKDLGLSDEVIITDFIEEKDKPALLSGAKLLVSPSFWEGFGLHVLESMACGTPVVVSKVGSLPEIVGNAGIMVNPNNTRSIENGILKVLEMSKERYNKLKEYSILQANKFSWEKTAKATLKILEEAHYDYRQNG